MLERLRASKSFWKNEALKHLGEEKKEDDKKSMSKSRPSTTQSRKKDDDNRTIWQAGDDGDVKFVKEYVIHKRWDVRRHHDRGGTGSTLLHKACWRSHVGLVKWLIEHVRRRYGAEATETYVNSRDTIMNGVTPLMIACRSGRLPVVMALFANATRRDLISRNKKGENCLFNAVRSRNVEVVQFISSRMNPYGIQRRNISGDNVFHLAAKFGERVMLQHLRKNEGGRLDTLMRRNNKKWSPMHFAIFCGHLLVVRQLLKWGVPDLSEEETRRLMRLGDERSEAYVKEGIPMATPEEREQVRLRDLSLGVRQRLDHATQFRRIHGVDAGGERDIAGERRVLRREPEGQVGRKTEFEGHGATQRGSAPRGAARWAIV